MSFHFAHIAASVIEFAVRMHMLNCTYSCHHPSVCLATCACSGLCLVANTRCQLLLTIRTMVKTRNNTFFQCTAMHNGWSKIGMPRITSSTRVCARRPLTRVCRRTKGALLLAMCSLMKLRACVFHCLHACMLMIARKKQAAANARAHTLGTREMWHLHRHCDHGAVIDGVDSTLLSRQSH